MTYLEWQDRKACGDLDPNELDAVFFPHHNSDAAEAKAICITCPVMSECGLYAIETRQEFGVWGCMTEKERARIIGRGSRSAKRSNEPTTDERCGTYKGSSAHRRRDEWLCDDCRTAKSDYELTRARAARSELGVSA